MRKFLYFLLLFNILLLVFSCKKEKTFTTSWNELSSPTQLTLNSVFFTNDSTGHIVGGDRWNASISLKTTDAGNTWTIDSLMGKELYGLHFNNSKSGFAVSWGGDFYFKDTPQSNWIWHNLSFPFEVFRDVSYWENKNGIVVTGGAFQDGKIIKVDDSFQAVLVDTFEQELSAVFHSEKDIVHAVGFGLVLRSTDGGNTWQNKGIIGDFFRAIHFPTSQVGYVVGSSGSIIKTEDAGNTWSFIRNGDNLSTSNEPFRSVFFTDNENGYIVGERGLFWKTEDGGSTWEVIEEFIDEDFHDVFVINDRGYIVGKNGQIISFKN